MEGKLQEALSDSAQYIQTRQKIDSENLKNLFFGLSKSRDQLLNGISSAFAQENQEVEETLSVLEATLLSADLGSSMTNTIINDLRAYSRTEKLNKEDIKPVLRARLIDALTAQNLSTSLNFQNAPPSVPFVIFVIGANGMGKTTTIGKLAARLREEANLSVLVGACDTFRAAAVEQLQEWTKRANVSIELPQEEERGGSPIPALRRTLQRAIEDKIDVVIIDTAGRLSNNFELTMQLQDMKKAIQAAIPSAPHETLLVVDASVGRNAVEQAKSWNKNVGVSGIIVTKMDGTARAGFVVSTVQDLKIPIKLIGVGESIEDLRDFDPVLFVDALLGNDASELDAMKERAEKILQTAAQNDPRNLLSTDEIKEMMSSSLNEAALTQQNQPTSNVRSNKRKKNRFR
eukprot:gene13905-15345_t